MKSDPQKSHVGDHENRILHGIFPQFFDDGMLYASKRREVIVSSDLGGTWAKICDVPSTPLDAFMTWRPIDRIVNWSILNVARTGAGTLLIVANRRLFRLGDAERTSTAVFSIGHKHSPMHRGLCVSRKGHIYLAEYFANLDRRETRIYGSDDDGRTWDSVYRFDGGQIRHVHAIVQDPVAAERIWVLTGDEGNECRIAFTSDNFKTLEVVGKGGQEWRATSLLFSGDYIYWGMDSPLEPSFIMRMSLTSGTPEKLQEVDGPIYYGAVNELGRMFFGTTVEPGPSVKDNVARIWTSIDGEDWNVIREYDGGRLPQHGIIYFPRGILPGDSLVYRCRALRRTDNKAYLFRTVG